MPSPKSREVSFYYGNPQNRFWRVLAALWDEPVPGMGADGRLLDDVDAVNEARRELCHRRHVALWDVLASCRIAGASDASISKPVANDVAGLLDGSRIARVITTGSTATRLYRRLVEPVCGVGCTGLPSTSPANASWSLPRLVEAYAPLREAADS
jgi:hypoxanthine-DNA glycosylase